MKKQSLCFTMILYFVVWIVFSSTLFAQEKQRPFHFLSNASTPSQLFNVPKVCVLQSLELAFSGGGSFGIDGGDALIRDFVIGLGGIAELELRTSGVTNRLTGKSERVPTSSFKVHLIPERLRHLRYLPEVAVQLRSARWQYLGGGQEELQAEYAEVYDGQNLQSIDEMMKRFSVLYVIVGKDWSFGGIHFGVSQTDVRTRGGTGRYYHIHDNHIEEKEMPEIKKGFMAPFGGFEIVANNKTCLIAEIQAVPLFDYDVEDRSVQIHRTWLGVAGIRFFLTQWLSLDTGVKYQSNFHGIADSEIDIGLNMIIPIQHR